MFNRYLPLFVYSLFLLVTFLAFEFSPIQYKEMKAFPTFFFVVGIFLVTNIGFIAGVKGEIYPRESMREHSYYRIRKIIGLLLILTTVLCAKDWLAFIASGRNLDLTNVGANYVNAYAGYVRGSAEVGVLYVLDILESSIVTLTLILAITYQRRLSQLSLYALYFIIFTYLTLNVVADGKQKYLGDILIFYVSATMLVLGADETVVRKSHIVWFVLVFAIAIAGFAYLLNSRYSAIGLDATNIVENLNNASYWDRDAWVLKLTGEGFGFGLSMFLSYFTIGIYGLSVCLAMPFQWTYFIGSSYAVSRVFEVMLGIGNDLSNGTYPARAAEYGWGLEKWHSAYSWLASDFTFPGVIIISCIISFAYGRVWNRALNSLNPLAGPIFVYLTLGLFFSFSNNQLVHSLSGVITLMILWFLYAISAWQKTS